MNFLLKRWWFRGDTNLGGVELHFDYYAATLSRDSAMKLFTARRAMYNDLTITMYDYESVISADKKEE